MQGDLVGEAQFVALIVGTHTTVISQDCEQGLFPAPRAIEQWLEALARSHRILSDLQALRPATPALVVALSHLIEATATQPLDLETLLDFDVLAADAARRQALISIANKALERLRPSFLATAGEHQS